jgi:hypothetical protein
MHLFVEYDSEVEVVDIFNTFLGNFYSLILVGWSGRYEFVKIAVSFRCQNS